MAYTIAFFGSKPYDEASFNEKNSEYGFELRYYKGHLNLNNVILTQGVDAVCIFVNDTADAEVIRLMAANGVKLLAVCVLNDFPHGEAAPFSLLSHITAHRWAAHARNRDRTGRQARPPSPPNPEKSRCLPNRCPCRRDNR